MNLPNYHSLAEATALLHPAMTIRWNSEPRLRAVLQEFTIGNAIYRARYDRDGFHIDNPATSPCPLCGHIPAETTP
jgi:hypothetical protein